MPGATYNPVEIGRQLVLGDGELSWRHCSLARVGDETAGMLPGFPETPPSDAKPNSYEDLVAEAGGGWHISKLAVHAHWRGRGIAGRLLDEAARQAAESASLRQYLITPDSFIHAIGFYRDHGFVERGRHPLHLPPDVRSLDASQWVLLVSD